MADLVSEDLKEREEVLVSEPSSPKLELVAGQNCSLCCRRVFAPTESWIYNVTPLNDFRTIVSNPIQHQVGRRVIVDSQTGAKYDDQD
jgi:hypothetical protein